MLDVLLSNSWMQNFLNSPWSIVLAVVFAAMSLFLIHFGAQARAKASNDATLKEMEKQFDSLFDGVEKSSKENMVAIRKAGEEIIRDLTKDSEKATEEIKTETQNIVGQFQSTYGELEKRSKE